MKYLRYLPHSYPHAYTLPSTLTPLHITHTLIITHTHSNTHNNHLLQKLVIVIEFKLNYNYFSNIITALPKILSFPTYTLQVRYMHVMYFYVKTKGTYINENSYGEDTVGCNNVF